MELNNKTSFDMVQNINISSMCFESYPCLHTCEISLSNGHKKSVILNNPEIYAFIQELPLKKITFTPLNSLLHFYSLKDHNVSWTNEPIAEDILANIFSETIGNTNPNSDTNSLIEEAEVYSRNYSINL